MFSYALAKIFKTQFHFGPVYEADYNISHYDGFMLTWYYFGYSRTYGLIIAGCQILAGNLILFRKTERIGTILLLSFMINILLVNIFYEIGQEALLMSLSLTLMGFFLLISDWRGFLNYFFKINFSQKETTTNLKLQSNWLSLLALPILLFVNINDIKKSNKQNDLIGVWKAINPNQNYFKIYFDEFMLMKIKDFEEKTYFGVYEINKNQKAFKFDSQYYSEIGAFKVQDSINKLNLNEDEIDNIRDDLISHFNKEMNIIELKNEFSYKINNDTLILFQNSQKKQYFLNITKNYPSLMD
ncbi:hypothetical protein BTO18_00915 [Polaribacter porphyrae]|uniref:Uncharacterized protein n=2 Tax=Polaribacter porphyrae TaxID=1137780 RepID=A0A2S7WKJ6_9FLAO|nr:hypothetical protein BTO18_00915 [Polaribacter porphyrae]